MVLSGGSASGAALVLDEPLSFWGGIDAADGRVIDVHHPQLGRSVAGRVLLLPSGRGSSSSSSVLAEAIRLGTAPAAILLGEADPILAVGAAVARELYGLAVPVLAVEPEVYSGIRTGDHVEVDATRADDPQIWTVPGPGPEPAPD